MAAGFANIGDVQFLPGYCVLLVDTPNVQRLGRPVWLYPLERWSDPATALGPEHDDLRAELTAEIDRLLLSRS